VSFVYRPTPVITLSGKTVGHDGVTLSRLPAGTMHGYTPNMASPALNAIGRRTLKGNPWLIRSGTMNGFLGQDDGVDIVQSNYDPGTGLDLSLPPVNVPQFYSVPGADLNLAPTSYSPSTSLVTPPSAVLPSVLNTAALTAASTQTPAYQAQLAAAGFPGAPAPGQAAQVAAGGSILTSIANLFKSTTSPTPMTAVQPGVYKAATVTPSFFAQSTLLPGIPNATALIGGVFVIALFAMMAGGKK
jgi:hypothetical protein